MISLNSKHVSILLNLALASRKIETLSLPHKRIRPMIHIIIFGRVGSTKSSILYDIARKLNIPVVTGLTKANLYGIVDKDGDVIPPTIWDCNNSFLLIDEYHVTGADRSGRELLNSLLSVMENSEYEKKISFKARPFKQGNAKLFCKIEKGRLKVKSKFGLILNTMLEITKSELIEIQALRSRCLCIPIYPSRAILDEIAEGKHLFNFKDLRVKKKDVKINKKIYTQIKDYVKKSEVDDKCYLRKIGDLCRVYAVLGKIDQDIFNLILSLP